MQAFLRLVWRVNFETHPTTEHNLKKQLINFKNCLAWIWYPYDSIWTSSCERESERGSMKWEPQKMDRNEECIIIIIIITTTTSSRSNQLSSGFSHLFSPLGFHLSWHLGLVGFWLRGHPPQNLRQDEVIMGFTTNPKKTRSSQHPSNFWKWNKTSS